MKFDYVNRLSNDEFRRITGVKPKTFRVMVEILKEADKKKKEHGGRPNSLCIEEMLLMTLEYLREYRSLAHIGASYSMSESGTFKIVRLVENVLIKSEKFRLPGKKALLKKENKFEIVLIDGTESPIQRPKKNNVDITLGNQNAILKRPK